MYNGDDRDALLFGSISSQASSEAGGAAPTGTAQLTTEARLFPENQPPARLTVHCRGDNALDKALESEPSLKRSGVQEQQPARRQRHISLFASIELTRPKVPLPGNGEAGPFFLASEPSHQVTALAVTEQKNPLSATPAVDGVAASRCQAPKSAVSSLRPKEREGPSLLAERKDENVFTLQQCDGACSNPLRCGPVNNGELSPSFKSVEGLLALPRLGNIDAQSFVAQELQEEEETAAAVALATNALRQRAQELLNQAAEKLERLALQQRKRTEASAEKAASILRRATEARCALRHERNMLEQLRRRHGGEQQLKLKATAEALDAERRRCVDLEARMEALQQENRQLRAALHRAQPPQTRGLVNSKQLSATDASSSNRKRHQTLGCHPTTRCTAQQDSAETASLTAVVLPAVPPAQGARGGCRSCSRQPGKAIGPNSRSTDSAGRQALLDVEVRLPPAACSAASARSACNEKQTHDVDIHGAQGAPDRPQLQPEGCPCPPQLDALSHHISDTGNSKCSQTTDSVRKHRHRNRSAGSSAFRTDESTSSNGSMSSCNKLERRRRLRQRMRHGNAQLQRSLSRGSVSTSSSSAAPDREKGRRRSHSTRRMTRAPLHPRISFSVPQPSLQQPLEVDDDSSSGSSVPRRTRTSGHKLALRGDVAGRLQASLMRLQERQALQGKIQNIAQQLLHPHQA
ncbi:uncharacterized protein EMH_0014120 [Eimeria mitis]|uniref:Uncharacterized protein n=1 Tax=Eimeria mitis TaxID=44415 RepID=U6K9N9_9EIME|nr:uncharacterized protein EMH_0014120 [Eimeria mitis]CDJ32902.1 hypothetical protein, conserved [Eimeria mitis]